MKLSVNPDKLAFQAKVSKDTGTKLTLMNAAHDGNPYQIFTTIKQIENMKSDDEISFARKSAKY